MNVKDVGLLEAARKGKGWSQSELAARSGVQQGNISAYERGSTPLGITAARKLGKALDANPAVLVIHSQKARLEAAMKRDDSMTAITAAKSIVEASQELPLDQADENALNALVAQVVEFAEKFASGVAQDTEAYGQVEGEGRDLMGRKAVSKSAGAADSEPTPYPLHPGHLDGATRDEIEDEDEIIDDGRDLYGFRVAPLPDRDDA